MAITLAPKVVNWLHDPAWIEIDTSLISGGEASEPNLSCYVQIEQDGDFLTEFNAPYSLATATTDFDLGDLANIYPEAPDDAAIGAAGQGVLDHVSAKLTVMYADMYGSPAEKPESLASSAEYTFIYGHTPYWYGIGASGADALLHSYMDSRGISAIKEVRKGQDEYVYIYSHGGSSVAVTVEIIYTDDTSSADTSVGSLTCSAGKVSWMNVGWTALDLESIADPMKRVNSYVLKFALSGGTQVIIYALDDHDTEYDEYILYENGLGGCEVVRCSGRHRINIDAKKDYAQRARGRGSNFRDGMATPYNVRGGEVWPMQTGYYNHEYIRHLGQIFFSTRVWYIDTFRQKFTAVTIRDTGSELVDFDNDLYSIGFNMTFAERPSVSTFGI